MHRKPNSRVEGDMAETTLTFDDGAAYERFMGRWSRAVGAIFLD